MEILEKSEELEKAGEMEEKQKSTIKCQIVLAETTLPFLRYVQVINFFHPQK